MKSYLCTVLFLFTTVMVFAQNGEEIQVESYEKLYVSFSANFDFDDSRDYFLQAVAAMPELKNVQELYDFSLKKAIHISNDQLENMQIRALKNGFTTTAVKNLRNIFEVVLTSNNKSELEIVSKKLQNIIGVRYCELMYNIPPPPGDILPITPSFTNLQDYAGPDPGVNMQYAWNLGIGASNVRIKDIEYGFNKNHEEFNTRVGARIAEGMNISTQVPQLYKEHGTAVFGIIYGDNGSYGITGLANDAQELIFFPEWEQSGANRINAISQAINQSTNGDIIVFEMQDYGQNNQLVPAEINNVVWDLTRAASDAGITVVAAAGNGSQNLDSNYYSTYRNRGDSGAIIVGAGTSDIQHNRFSTSTYGTRVDLQAWGSDVYTTGYIYLINYDENQSYGYFGGTSAATAIVASCVGVLQSHFFSLNNDYLSSIQLRNILKQTGISQGSGGNVGPIPNMQNAIQYLSNLNINDPGRSFLSVYPNPARSVLNIRTQETIKEIFVYDLLGKKLAVNRFAINAIDVSFLSQGMYIITMISENDKVYSSKFLKE